MKPHDDFDEQNQASLQLLQESSLRISKVTRQLDAVSQERIEKAAGSQPEGNTPRVALQMAEMINSSRSIQPDKSANDKMLVRPMAAKMLDGRLKEVTKPQMSSRRMYNLRSKEPTSQKRSITPEPQPDTYEVQITPLTTHTSALTKEESPVRGKGTTTGTAAHRSRSSVRRMKSQDLPKQAEKAQSAILRSPVNLKRSKGATEGPEVNVNGEKAIEDPGQSMEGSGSTSAGEQNNGYPKKNVVRTRQLSKRRAQVETTLAIRQTGATSNTINEDTADRKTSSKKTQNILGSALNHPIHQDEDENEANWQNPKSKTQVRDERKSVHHDDKNSKGLDYIAKGADAQDCGMIADRNINGEDQEGRAGKHQYKICDRDFYAKGHKLRQLFAGAEEIYYLNHSMEGNKDVERITELVGMFANRISDLESLLKMFPEANSINSLDKLESLENNWLQMIECVNTMNLDTKQLNKPKQFDYIYTYVVANVVLMLREFISHGQVFNAELKMLVLKRPSLDIFIETASSLSSFGSRIMAIRGEKTKATNPKIAGRVEKAILTPLEDVTGVLRRERESIIDREEEQASHREHEKEAAYREQQLARLRERKERAEARKDEWHSLHVARLAAEPDPRRFAHLRLKELASDVDLDANGQPFERLELFAPRIQASPAMSQTTAEDYSDWADEELATLLEGLKTFAGPSVFYDIFATYCRPGESLRRYNVQQTTRKAAYLRRLLMEADLAQSKDSEGWIYSIPVYE